MTALLDGRAVDERWALNRGLQYGDGVFRTCLVHRGTVVALQRQLRKLLDDAARLQLRVADEAALRDECERLARTQQQAVLKVVLTRAGAERGYRSTGEISERLVSLHPLPPYAADSWTQGIRARRTGFRLGAQPRLAGIKHLNRLEQVLAARECGDAQEGVVDDAQGRPLGGTRSNLFWVSGGRVRTPPLDQCGVAGLTRELVLEHAAGEITAGEWDELLAAEEVFVTSSLIGVCPVRALDGRSWSAPGPVTRQLMNALKHPRLEPE